MNIPRYFKAYFQYQKFVFKWVIYHLLILNSNFEELNFQYDHLFFALSQQEFTKKTLSNYSTFF